MHLRQGGEGSSREEVPEVEVEQKEDGSFITHSHLRLQVTFATGKNGRKSEQIGFISHPPSGRRWSRSRGSVLRYE